MGKKPLWLLAIVLALLTAAFLFVQAGFFAVQGPPPSPPAAEPAAAPPAPAAAETPSPAASGTRSGQMKLADKPKAFEPGPPVDADYSYTLRKNGGEREILPGVTIMSGTKGVSIKTADKDETIQIKRDSTNSTSDIQVMWQKKH